MLVKKDKPRTQKTRRSPALAEPRGWTTEQKQRIAELAYSRFLALGGEPGHEMEDWLSAEVEFAASLRP